MLRNRNYKYTLDPLPKHWVALVLLLLVAIGSIRSATANSDILYVDDVASNTVRRFNADTGSPIGGGSKSGVFVKQSGDVGSGGLDGPRGLFLASGRLFVANQNVNQPYPGEVLRYELSDGLPAGALVPSSDPHAPFAPRGIISWKGVVYVADFLGSGSSLPPGRLLAFDQTTGKFLREFSPSDKFAFSFHPRGLVIGPNGLLYVANFPDLSTSLGGQVLVFDPKTLDFVGAFISDAGGPGQLNRPEGLVFGPDGNLYITSFRADPTDTDSIRIYAGHSGVYIGKIDLDTVGQPRSYGQALLFGPGGKLFVPMSAGPTAGQVRRYDVTTPQTYDVFVVPPAGATSELWYLTFGKTNPGTLAYEGRDDHPHAGGGDLLPPTAKPKGYSLSDIAKATAAFSVSGPGNRSSANEPKIPFQILYTSDINKPPNTFSVRPGTMLYVPIAFADDSPIILGTFPDFADSAAVANYFFSPDQLGAEFLEIVVDGQVASIGEDSGYAVGVKTPPLPDGGGTHYLTVAVFLTPFTKGTHTVTIRGKFTGTALGGETFEFKDTYTVTVKTH